MSSSFLTQIGLGNVDIGLLVLILAVLILVTLILTIVNVCSIFKVKKKYRKFMTGKNAKSLENELVGLFEDNKFMKASIEKNKKDIRMLYKDFESAFQKVGIVKYDAFNQMGGKLSFSMALLDQNNNGFILNSVHSTDGCYSYTKVIENGQSKISLGEEEQKALNIAMNEDED